MEKRLVLISVVMTIGGLVWLTVLQHVDKAEATPDSPSADVAAGAVRPKGGGEAVALAGSPSEATPEGSGSAAASAAAGASPPVALAGERVAKVAEQTVEMTDGDGLRVVLSTKGGALRSAFLLNPQYDRRADAEVPAAPPPTKTAPGPLDLVSTWDADFYPFQLDFSKLEADGAVRFDDGVQLSLAAAWSTDADFGIVSSAEREVVFVWPDPARATSPLYVERTYRLTGRYQLSMQTRVFNLTAKDAVAQFDVVVHGWQDPSASTGSMFSPQADLAGGACFAGDSLTFETYHDLLEEQQVPPGQVQWGGVATHYFLMAALPEQAAQTQCSLLAVPGGLITTRIHQTQSTVIGAAPSPCAPDWLSASRFQGARCSELYALLGASPGASPKELADAKGKAVAAAIADDARRRAIEQAYESLVSGGQRTWVHTLYTGPKDIDALHAAGEALREALDFGMLSFIAVPMLYFMRWVHSVLGLWVMAIILLTVLVKVLMLPLTQKSFKQMKQMKLLQPEIEKLREKFKDDKAKLNSEMMALYKTRGANPLGGCLPMLLQMPVYIALYQTIYSAVELYQAPLFGWINNMTAPDPYFVLPVLLGVTMFVQQKLMPTTMDSAQAKMMAIVMPIMFAGMMLFLPAGLVLYIFVNTLLGIAQQWYVYRQGT